MKEILRSYENCRLCPRACGAERLRGKMGVCHAGYMPRVAHSMLHHWEEPCLSGENGSGTVFFSGCSLGCVYCQNRAISRGSVGEEYDEKRLADLYLSLAERGAHNINLVTASHHIPHVVLSVASAKARGLSIPVVFNTSSYDRADSLKMLEGVVDIWLADFRYLKSETAEKYSAARNYPVFADEALAEMVRQSGAPVFDENGMMRRGVIVRLLLLPGHLIECKMILRKLFLQYGNAITFSLMSQYTPPVDIKEKYPELAEKVLPHEYASLVSYARSLGIIRAYTQEGDAASESFIPPFSV